MRSFAGGQVNSASKRSDDQQEYKTAARIMSDWLIETTDTLVPRPGRRLLTQIGDPREEYARLGSTDFAIAFGVSGGNGQITISDLSTNLVVATSTSPSYIWTAATVDQIYMTVADTEIVICYPGMRPQLAVRAPTTGAWTFGGFAFRVITNQSQQPFYRSGNLGATMSWDNNAGTTHLTCSQAYFTGAMLGNIISILGQQVFLQQINSSTQATGACQDFLPQFMSLAVSDGSPFEVGQIAELSTGGFKIEISSVTPHFAPPAAPGQLPTQAIVGGVLTSSVLNSHFFQYGDILVSEKGAVNITGQSTFNGGTTVQWQEQFMGDALGWPRACSYDKSRLIFFDFPQKPEAILWSAIGAYDVFWVDSSAATLQAAAGAEPTAAILEFIPKSPRVRHVIGWGDQFVFTDKGIYDIPIAAAGNPLQPGSVDFRQFSNDGVSGIVPITTQDSIIYINAGLKRASLVIRTGSLTNPYTSDGSAELYTDLFTGPIAMTVASGDGEIPERLIYILNADGSVIHGRFTTDRKFVGWMPWFSQTPPSWLFCSGPDVYYTVPLGGSFWRAAEDASLYLDDAATPNAVPAAFPAPPAGDGPLWFVAGQTVTVMDGLLDMGERAVDPQGNLVATAPDDILTSPTLTVGFSYQPKLQPFVPAAQPGESVGQRQHRRKISQALVTAEQSTGFTLGTKQFPAYQFGDDTTQPPLLRDMVARARPLGRSYDPGILLTKERPGPLRIVEFSIEATV